MTGHPHDGLIWAPDPHDDLAFTLYAKECSEIDELKAEIAHYVNQLEYPYTTVQDMIRELSEVFPETKSMFNIYDWTEMYEDQYGR